MTSAKKTFIVALTLDEFECISAAVGRDQGRVLDEICRRDGRELDGRPRLLTRSEVAGVPLHQAVLRKIEEAMDVSIRDARAQADKRFFVVDDGGASYCLVARDLEHAKQLLRDAGVEFTSDDGNSHPIDAPVVAGIGWREISAEDAAKKRVRLGDDGAPPQSVLAACAIGDWFTSEI